MLINRSSLNRFQKRINSALTWLLPFVWALVVKAIVKRPLPKVIIKKDRKTRMTGVAAGEGVAGTHMGG